MADEKRTQRLQMRSLPDGTVGITLDGTPLPPCHDISIFYRPDENKFHVGLTIMVPELELDVEATTEVKALLRYSGPLDSDDDRRRLACNTAITTERGPFASVNAIDRPLRARMELPELLAIVEKWQGRQRSE